MTEKPIESLEKGISIVHLFGSLVKEILLCILLRNSQSTQDVEESMQSWTLSPLPKQHLI